MPRIRSVHPTQWHDEHFVSCSAFARLLAIALRNDADDNGVFEWKPVSLKMRLFPNDDVAVGALLDELLASNQVMQYETPDGSKYGLIRSFQRFQSPHRPFFRYPVPNPTELPRGYDLHPEFFEKGQAVLMQCMDIARTLHTQQGKGKGNGRKEEDSAELAAPAPPEDVVCTFPCAGKSEWVLTKAKLAEYRNTFGEQLDVDREVKHALQWAKDNRSKRKTPRGMPAFLNRWFVKAIDSPRGNGKHPAPNTPDAVADAVLKSAGVRP